MKRLVLLLVAAAECRPGPVAAAVVEEVMEVPVCVKPIRDEAVSHRIKVTVFRDDARDRAPYLVLNHGRAVSKDERANMKRVRYSDNSRYFASLGFVVFVPTRVGYGESGGVDMEDPGPNDARVYPPAFAAVAQQTLAVLEAAGRLTYVDMSKGIVVGQSFGGMAALTLSTMRVPGLRGVVNFAGGSGGDPDARPGQPIGVDRLEELIRAYGAASVAPTLWFYSENDRFWGPDLPRKWFELFVSAGGRGTFVALPPHDPDGHKSFVGNREAWMPAFETFIRELGFDCASAERMPGGGR